MLRPLLPRTSEVSLPSFLPFAEVSRNLPHWFYWMLLFLILLLDCLAHLAYLLAPLPTLASQ